MITKHSNSIHRFASLLAVGTMLLGKGSAYGQFLFQQLPTPNSSGMLTTFNPNGINFLSPFFFPQGTNGRACSTCHLPDQGWSISAAGVKARFALTNGLDPIFRTNDGSNCDHNIDTSTLQGRQAAYSLVTDRGLIRIVMAVPSGAEFAVVSVANPYGCNEKATLSVYRRPLPTANVRFLSTVMWDGRESSSLTGTQAITKATNPTDLRNDLANQAQAATLQHAQAVNGLTQAQQFAIADFVMNLYAAQTYDSKAGSLTSVGATSGPVALATTTLSTFSIGVNDSLGASPFSPNIFNLYNSSWVSQAPAFIPFASSSPSSARASILRGQTLFNSKPITITAVSGLNDLPGEATITGTCGTCHDTPNVGNHSLPLPLNIGVGDLTSPLDLSYLPVITLRNNSTGELKATTDPGRALVTGLWKDVGKVKGPILRGLASRAPYFHNGSAQTLDDVLTFYNTRFNIGFSAQERLDLIAFLNSL